MIGFTVTLVVALMFQSYWALVAGMVASRISGVALSYGLQPYRPRWSLAAYRELFSFSSWIFMVNLLTFVRDRSSHFIVGRLHGSGALGLYTVGSEIALLPVTDLMAPINRAVFPGYARSAGSLEVLRRNFQDVTGLLGILALPASFGVAALAGPVVGTMLGDKWKDAVVFVQILAFTGACHAATSNHYSAWLALSKTGTVAFVGAVHVGLLLPLMVVLSRSLGVVGIAYAELIATFVTIIGECVMMSRALGLPRWFYPGSLWRPVVASTVMALGVMMTSRELASGHRVTGALWQLVVGIPLGAAIYAAALILLWRMAGRPRGAESLLLEHAVQAASDVRRKFGPTRS